MEKEYIVYLRHIDGALIVTSRERSVIEKQDLEQWDEAIDILSEYERPRCTGRLTTPSWLNGHRQPFLLINKALELVVP